MSAQTAVLVGNPRPRSRTRAAAELVIRELSGGQADVVVDLAELGPALLDPADDSVDQALASVGQARLVVVASPTYQATYTGLLKVALDRMGRLNVVAVPLLLGGSPAHSLAVEHTLVPLLHELGASVPTRGLYVVDSAYDDPDAYTSWLTHARPQIEVALAPSLTGAS